VLCDKGSTILKSIDKKWQSLLDNPSVKESDIHKFLSDHAGLFFGQDVFVISRPELGSDFQADFVVASDQASYGIDYKFVEIETPQSALYTRSGDPSARLTHAIQQVFNWKTWLTRHRGHVRRFFPSKYFGWDEFTNLSFCIVIGRRTHGSYVTAKRNVLAQEVGISIRSFDYLSDMLELRFSFLWYLTPHSERGRPHIFAANQLANPFARAYSWQGWKNVVENRDFDYCHIVAKNAESLLANHTYSKESERFLKWWGSLPARKRAQYASRRLNSESYGKMWIEFDK
jgi:hypothetical protein